MLQSKWRIVLLLMVWGIASKAKKASKMKDMLANVKEKEAEVLKQVDTFKKMGAAFREMAKPISGYHQGMISHYEFEYKQLNGWMTPKEAVTKCEADLACGGFTFYGSNLSSQDVVFVFFVHFIEINLGINKKTRAILSWTTYRSRKKYLLLPGVSLLERQGLRLGDNANSLLFKEAIRKAEDFQDLVWPFENTTVVSYDKSNPQNNMRTSTVFLLAEHDFSQKDWITLVNVNDPKLAKYVHDGHYGQYDRCCKDYDKPLADTDLRFHESLDDNIKVVNCKELSGKDFEDKYVRTRTPVKIIGCFDSLEEEQPQIDDLNFFGSSMIREAVGAFSEATVFSPDQIKTLIKNNALLNVEAPIKTMKARPSLIPGNLLKDEFDGRISMTSEGTGIPMRLLQYKDLMDVEYKGSKWWVITPVGSCLSPYSLSCSTKCSQPNSIWAASTWFNSIQPQLQRSQFHGRPTVQTIQRSGEIVYVPAASGVAFYTLRDSLAIMETFYSVGNLDTLHFGVDPSLNEYENIKKVVNDMDKERIDNVRERWEKWEEEDGKVAALSDSYGINL